LKCKGSDLGIKWYWLVFLNISMCIFVVINQKNKTVKKIIGLSLVMSALFITSCGNDQVGKNQEEKNNVADKSNTTPEQKTYPVSLVNNKKDPACGMPVTAGISDTLHYGKYVLGFCAEGCKKEFLKNPKGNIAAAELKK